MLNEMPSSELTYWMAYFDEQPFDWVSDNYYSATLKHLIYSMFKGKDSPQRDVSDFLIRVEEKKQETTEELVGKFNVLRSIFDRKKQKRKEV